MTTRLENTFHMAYEAVTEMLADKDVPWILRTWDEAVNRKRFSKKKKRDYLNFLLGVTAFAISTRPHSSGKEITAHAGIDGDNLFIVAESADGEHHIEWYAHPIEHEGRMVHERDYGWHQEEVTV